MINVLHSKKKKKNKKISTNKNYFSDSSNKYGLDEVSINKSSHIYQEEMIYFSVYYKYTIS